MAGWVVKLLQCSWEDLEKKENEGLLAPTSFWRDRSFALSTNLRWTEYCWSKDDSKHYPLEQVLALMPARSEMAGYLRTLIQDNKHLKAGQVALGFFRPYVRIKIARREKLNR